MVQPAELVGQVVDDRWLLIDHLGSGRFGDVYAADPRHLELATGAVKLMQPQNDGHREQILREIQALSELTNDALVTYRDSGQIHAGVLAGMIYVVTELCDGTLADEKGWASQDADFEADLTVALTQVAEGLRYLHDRRYVHRDVKPTNILRSGDRWKLSDFGLIRDLSEPSPSRGIQGTAPYLAPETSSRDGAGPPADIFALGVVVHEALTGTWPYDRTAGPWTGPPTQEGASITISPDLPEQWLAMVEPCLNTEPSRRPTASQIEALLPPRPVRPTTATRARTPSRTRSVSTLPPPSDRPMTWVNTIIGGLLVIAAIAAGVLLWPSDDEPVTSTDAGSVDQVDQVAGDAAADGLGDELSVVVCPDGSGVDTLADCEGLGPFAPNPFVGWWEVIDDVNSYTVSIDSAGRIIGFVSLSISFCPAQGFPSVAARFTMGGEQTGPTTWEGDGAGEVTCLPLGAPPQTFQTELPFLDLLEFDPVTDTITTSAPACWWRRGSSSADCS